MLLVLTNREDMAADYLITHLIDRRLPYFRLNADEMATARPAFQVGGGSEIRRIEVEGAAVDLDHVGCVWYRRAIRPKSQSQGPAAFAHFGAMELRHLYEGMLLGTEARWVNPFETAESSERKLFQIYLAEHCGLTVPPTRVDTDTDALQRFAIEHERVICKPLSQGLVSDNGAWFAVHTREVHPEEIGGNEDLGGLPLLVQQLVPQGADIRLTIIGESVFPVEVVTPEIAPIDWRAVREGLQYRACELPSEVERGCRTLMEARDSLRGVRLHPYR